MLPIRVDFYLAKEEGIHVIPLLACDLIENTYRESLKEPKLPVPKILVMCSSKLEAEKLDDLLWSFKAEAFIPHQLLSDMTDQDGIEEPPIIIGWEESLNDYLFNSGDTLFNLSTKIPAFYRKCTRIIELVENSNTAKEVSRTHYRRYRTDGCDLFTHPL